MFTIPDAFWNYLVLNGYTGSVSDMQKQLLDEVGDGNAVSELDAATTLLFQNTLSATYAAGVLAFGSASGDAIGLFLITSSPPDGSLGILGNLALNTVNGDLYKKTGVSSWTLQGNFRGPTGATGATGATGSAGATGAPGATGSFITTFKGAWSGVTNYVTGDIVTNAGSSWLALRNNLTVTPVEGADWTRIAAAGSGVPTGGTSGQMLKKNSATDYDVVWATLAESDVTNLVSDLSAHTTAIAGKEPSITGGTTSQYWRGDKSWQNLFDSTNPAALGTAAPGSATVAAKRDHVHAMPTAANVGAEPTITGGTTSQIWRGDKTWITFLGTTSTTAASGDRGMPTGGTAGQVLTKNTGTNYDASWAAAGGGGGILATTKYNPSTASTIAGTTTTADVDATNLAVTFTAPASGAVNIQLCAFFVVSSAISYYWSLRESTTNLAGTEVAMGITTGATGHPTVTFRVTGLTSGNSYTYKWAHRISAAGTANFIVGGTTNEFSGLCYGAATMVVQAA